MNELEPHVKSVGKDGSPRASSSGVQLLQIWCAHLFVVALHCQNQTVTECK